ncbi:hypothetical protein UY3_11354 [Chelonia mydas]|uniref:Uncharacterized protein n=1 Tax=Chelonia mydas TaxID=8469 RepID=M7B7M5_CHEMY|nr:hypothetical protein UY3_11354 [Chelonia mydas]
MTWSINIQSNPAHAEVNGNTLNDFNTNIASSIPYHATLTSALLLVVALPSELGSWPAPTALQLPSSWRAVKAAQKLQSCKVCIKSAGTTLRTAVSVVLRACICEGKGKAPPSEQGEGREDTAEAFWLDKSSAVFELNCVVPPVRAAICIEEWDAAYFEP